MRLYNVDPEEIYYAGGEQKQHFFWDSYRRKGRKSAYVEKEWGKNKRRWDLKRSTGGGTRDLAFSKKKRSKGGWGKAGQEDVFHIQRVLSPQTEENFAGKKGPQ